MPQFNEAERNNYGGDIAGIESGFEGLTDAQKYEFMRTNPKFNPSNPGKARSLGSFDLSRRGDIVYLADPKKEFHFRFVRVDSTSEWAGLDEAAALEEGYMPALAKDFSLRPSKGAYLKKAANGFITHLGRTDKTFVIYYIPAAEYRKLKAADPDLVGSDDIQDSLVSSLGSISEGQRRQGNDLGLGKTFVAVDEDRVARTLKDE